MAWLLSGIRYFLFSFKQEWYYDHEILDQILCLLLALEFEDTTWLGDLLNNSCLLMTGLDYFENEGQNFIFCFTIWKKTPAEEKDDCPSCPFQTSDLIKFLQWKKCNCRINYILNTLLWINCFSDIHIHIFGADISVTIRNKIFWGLWCCAALCHATIMNLISKLA